MILIGDLTYSYDEHGRLHKRRGKGYLKQFPDKDGYLRYSLEQGTKTVNVNVHRIVWTIFNGEIPEGMTVDHIDNDKSNNVITNLQLLTAEDNAIKGNARKWIAVDRNNNLYEVYNMEQFCRDHNLHPGHMRATKHNLKRHKGWYCYE